MDILNQYPLLRSILLTMGYTSFSGIAIFLGYFLFSRVTRYDDTVEIFEKKNVAAALASGGKVVGTAIVLGFAIVTNDRLWWTALWGLIGILLLILGYKGLEWATPRHHVDAEIGKGNTAAGVFSFLLSVGLAVVIGASLT
ncbi:MAG: DUF350 domain-containing protein [Firmicutes bacterium]|nr:DUF350 domain-containing protein [Bacillota bacterium]